MSRRLQNPHRSEYWSIRWRRYSFNAPRRMSICIALFWNLGWSQTRKVSNEGKLKDDNHRTPRKKYIYICIYIQTLHTSQCKQVAGSSVLGKHHTGWRQIGPGTSGPQTTFHATSWGMSHTFWFVPWKMNPPILWNTLGTEQNINTLGTNNVAWGRSLVIDTVSCTPSTIELVGIIDGSRRKILPNQARHILDWKKSHDFNWNCKICFSMHPKNDII